MGTISVPTHEQVSPAQQAIFDKLKKHLGFALQRGHADQTLVAAFFDAGWTTGNLVNVMVAIGHMTISNDPHSTTDIPVDFPAAPVLEN